MACDNYQPTGYGAGCGIYSNGKWVQKCMLCIRIYLILYKISKKPYRHYLVFQYNMALL